MTNYEEARVKLTTSLLNKLESAAQNMIETILKITKKTFNMKNYFTNYS